MEPTTAESHIATAIMQAASYGLYETLMKMFDQPEKAEWVEGRVLPLIQFAANDLSLEVSEIIGLVSAQMASMFATVTEGDGTEKLDSFLGMVEKWR
ncbi:hypothetical protein C8J37_11633 [Rhizobium sp. PP-WC-1G-195]|nr:hypothetical protein C8J37_11633 [Rhizobium sp. PP-WC-1G-195]